VQSNATVIEAMPIIYNDDDAYSPSSAGIRDETGGLVEFIQGRMLRGLPHTIFWRISSALGQHYWRVNLRSVTKNANVVFPLDRLAAILNRIDLV